MSNLKLAYVGDGNNVTHSLLFGAVKVGMDICFSCSSWLRAEGKDCKSGQRGC